MTFSRGKPKAKPVYSDLNGDWHGEIMSHPLIVRITSSQMGTVAALDSPDEGVRNLPISNVVLSDGKVSFEIPKAGVKFNGRLEESLEQFSGKWLQRDRLNHDITFIKKTATTVQIKPNRPQHSVGKQPYLFPALGLRIEMKL
ncbi:MAG: hypothetical protein ACI9N9_001017 [Enterobacterales bacterium]